MMATFLLGSITGLLILISYQLTDILSELKEQNRR